MPGKFRGNRGGKEMKFLCVGYVVAIDCWIWARAGAMRERKNGFLRYAIAGALTKAILAGVLVMI